MKHLNLTGLTVIIRNRSEALLIQVSGIPIDTASLIILDESRTKEQLFSMGLEWLVNTYKSPKLIIQLRDREAGTIMSKTTTGLLVDSKVEYIDYTVKLYFNNGRINYEIGNFEHDGYGIIKTGKVIKAPWGAKGMVKRQYAEFQKKCNDEIAILIALIEKAFTQTIAKNDR